MQQPLQSTDKADAMADPIADAPGETGRELAAAWERPTLRGDATAETLQQAMLPQTQIPPQVAGVEIAYRYLPSGKAAVGGDWFDAIPLPRGRVALVVGDVMGHGTESAAVMGRFRGAVRTLAELDLRPDRVLCLLDALAQQLSEYHLATCIYVVYDPFTQRCEAANAGHIPPVLILDDGESYLLDLPSGAPIGVGGVPFEVVGFDVPDGSQLALCTDGLVEVRGQDIGFGLAELCASLAGCDRALEDTCVAITHALRNDDRDDDVALLMARFHGGDARLAKCP